ncbi:unnamed protein product [Paramecium sonneborni]|uniref:Uncharacterized protein n=1 Tax=Paramecium sonneborni TaxID=65129 RepID=A0A8S1QB99_9CILI|nr:unnamed protein product [Paramecium sonneborni]
MFRSYPEYFESNINFQYCNHIGVDQMTINYIFQIQEPCEQLIIPINQLKLWNILKQKIYSLKQINMSLFSVYPYLLKLNYLISIVNYDTVEIKDMTLTLSDVFILENTNNKVDITLKNLIFIQTNFSHKTIIQTQVHGNILFYDVRIIDSNFINSTFFQFQKQSISISITIKNQLSREFNFILNKQHLYQYNYSKYSY